MIDKIEAIRIILNFSNDRDELNDRDAVSTIVMRELRVTTGNRYLSYIDFDKYGKRDFKQKVIEYKRKHPVPFRIMDIGIQLDYYLRRGIFTIIRQSGIEQIIKDRAMNRVYGRARYVPCGKKH